MTAAPVDEGFARFAPAFEIRLKGQAIGREIINDVLDVTYTDDLENLDAFEFTLLDWDPVARLPKYSSPWDEAGNPRKIGDEGQYDAPNFEPGAEVELHLGYVGEGDLVLMLRGDVVSITPTFPASGAPTCRIRALNFLHKLQRQQVSGTFEGTALGVAEQIALDAGVAEVRFPPGAATAGESRRDVVSNANAYAEIFRRTRDAGLTIRLEDGDAGPVLVCEDQGDGAPVASLEWGRSLVSFAPQLSTRGQVAKVIVRGTDPTQPADAQRVTGEATWADLSVDRSALGARGLDEIDAALSGSVEEIDDAEVRNEADARTRALDRLKEIAGELIKGTGASIGAPLLRAGRKVEITGLGPRFSGVYRLTQTTHTIGAGGYTVGFGAKKLVLA